VDWVLDTVPGALLIGGVMWALRQTVAERSRYVWALCRGALGGVVAVVLLALPALLHGGGMVRLISRVSIAQHYLIAVPIGALIALALILVADGVRTGERTVP